MKSSIGIVTLFIPLVILSSGRARAETLLLKTGEKLDGEIIISYDRGIMFRERPETPGRYYSYNEVNRISTKDGKLYYLMPRGKKAHKKIPFRSFPLTRIILPTEKKIAPIPHVTLPRGDAVGVTCSGAENATTIVLDGGTKVRLLGLAPPPRSVGKKMKRLAADHLSKCVAGKSARLFPGPQRSDSNGIAEAYVVIDHKLLNAEMIQNGWACAGSHPENHPYKQGFASLEKFAKNLGRGIWGGSSH
jgi:endonuclease YncB( thermonuclease family)